MRFLYGLLLWLSITGCASEKPPVFKSAPAEKSRETTAAATVGSADSDTADDDAVAGAALRLNELLASNRSGLRDDAGESSDWVEIHNRANRALQLEGYRLTDDLEVLDKWVFPNQRIEADGYQLVWMSGLDRTSLAPDALRSSAAALPFETTLVAAGADWRYLPSGVDAQPGTADASPTGWTEIDFDDSQFELGPAGFGYGDEDDATQLPMGTSVVLMRREFLLEQPLESESLVLQVDYDDGFVAYLNGTRVAAVNAPAAEPGLSSLAVGNHEAGMPERFDLSEHAGLLRQGNNVLAVAGLNTSRTSSDLSIHPVLGILPSVCHASFRLKKKRGALYLVGADGKIVDQVEYADQVPDQSLGRSVDGAGEWGQYLTPSPGSANQGPQQPHPITSRITFVPEPGVCPANTEVQIEVGSVAEVDIRYTQDGSEPQASSAKYQGAITLDETKLFRAAAFVGDERAGDIVSATYLVGAAATLPVMSISMNPADFTEVHMRSAATGRGSERPAFLELFDTEGHRAVATGFGLRLHGGAGRRGSFQTKKSYRTYFRKAYGDGRLIPSVIPDAGVEDFDKLVLRANSNDRAPHGSSIRDQVIRDLHTDMGGLAAGGSWCVLLINGHSRGVYNITERMDEEFFASHLGPGEYDVMKTGETVLSGSRKGWDDLRGFVTSTDFSVDDNFKQLSQRVDIENFTSYIIVNLCLQNYDWPHNNWYAARRVPDGKWIFLCWDSEWGLGYRHPGVPDAPFGPQVDPYAFMDSGGAYGYGLIRLLFLAMLDNAGYRDYYQQEVRRHLSNALTTENILRQVHRHRDAIAAEIDVEYQARGYDKARWTQQLAEVEQFSQQCTQYFQQYTDAYFSYRSPPGGDNRVALIEDQDGRRHVIYRTAQGKLQWLVSQADGTSWSVQPVPIPATASPAAGRPVFYAQSPENVHVLYRGTAGHIHDLGMPASSAEDASWQHTNLTSLLQLPMARSDPSVTVVDGVPHVAYVDQDSRPRELWFDGAWKHHPLPVAPQPADGVEISSTDGGLHVTYRTLFGVPCEQTTSREAVAQGQRHWSHRLYHRLPAQGQPLGFNAGGRRRIIFRAAEQWPVREPFVFRWHARRQPGFREYDGPRDNLVQAWNDGRRTHRLQAVGEQQPPAAGNPYRVYDPKQDQHYFVYRDADGHVREATWKADAWSVTDLTALTGSPAAVSEPIGIVSGHSGSRHYVFTANDDHFYELYFDGEWHHRDIHP